MYGKMSPDRIQLIRRATILTFVSIFGFAGSEIVASPNDVDAVLGTSATFNCSSSITGTDVQWSHYPIGRRMRVIYLHGKTNLQYADRFAVIDGHNLHISSVAIDDAGTYECQDDHCRGEKQSADLVVLENSPICSSNINLEKIVGINILGIEPGLVILSCSVEYRGKIPPALEWTKNGDDKTITSGVRNEIRGNQILHHLTLQGGSIANGSSYNCRSAKATRNTATCNSSIITITTHTAAICESCGKYIVAIACSCSITVPPIICLCLYIFKRKEKRTLQGHQMKKAIKQLKAEKEVLLSRLENHEPRAEENYLVKPELVGTIATNDPSKKGQFIRGLAVFGNELFLAYRKSPEIEVYNFVTNQLERKFQIPYIKEAEDMTAGKTDECLFVIGLAEQTEKETEMEENSTNRNWEEQGDGKKEESHRMIQKTPGTVCLQREKPEIFIVRIDTNGTVLPPWPKSTGGWCGPLSTCEANLVVCFNDVNIIKEFSRDGDVVRVVRLPPSVGFLSPGHAVKVTKMHYAVSYGHIISDKIHRICLVDLDGNIKMTCRGMETENLMALRLPHHFIEDSNRSLLVTDIFKHRILLLGWNLKCRRILIQFGNGTLPNRLCFDEAQKKLFVSVGVGPFDKDLCDNASVLIYDVK